MVKINLVTFCLWGASLIAPAQAAEPPKAAEILAPRQKFLPEYKLPWQLPEKIRRYDSEAAWRKDNPDFMVVGRGYAEGLRRMPESEWRKSMAEMKEYFK